MTLHLFSRSSSLAACLLFCVIFTRNTGSTPLASCKPTFHQQKFSPRLCHRSRPRQHGSKTRIFSDGCLLRPSVRSKPGIDARKNSTHQSGNGTRSRNATGSREYASGQKKAMLERATTQKTAKKHRHALSQTQASPATLRLRKNKHPSLRSRQTNEPGKLD